MFGIGLPEMILILAIALIVVGPDKLPDLARSVAKGVMELKKTAESLKKNLTEDGNPLDAIKPELDNLLEPPDQLWKTRTPGQGVNPAPDAATGTIIDADIVDASEAEPATTDAPAADTAGGPAAQSAPEKGPTPPAC